MKKKQLRHEHRKFYKSSTVFQSAEDFTRLNIDHLALFALPGDNLVTSPGGISIQHNVKERLR